MRMPLTNEQIERDNMLRAIAFNEICNFECDLRKMLRQEYLRLIALKDRKVTDSRTLDPALFYAKKLQDIEILKEQLKRTMMIEREENDK